ncbi:MAG: signal peptidase I [Candidatus Paceibacterota bacterium]
MPHQLNIMETNTNPVEKKGTFMKELFNFALIVIFVVLPIRLFVAQPFVVVGTSMEPTFLNNDYLIVDELTYKLEAPKRGDVTVFKYDSSYGQVESTPTADQGSKYFIKRIIGLPGETVDIRGGKVTIFNTKNPNGFVLDETYVKAPPDNIMNVTLPQNEYFVMGDNREVSFDSRSWGPLNGSKIVGKVFVRLLPTTKIGVNPGSNAGKYVTELNK